MTYLVIIDTFFLIRPLVIMGHFFGNLLNFGKLNNCMALCINYKLLLLRKNDKYGFCCTQLKHVQNLFFNKELGLFE